MPRTARNLADDAVYHVLNRGNCGMEIFSKYGDFASFIKLLEEARRKFPKVRILGYCLMPDHWHLVLWPEVADDLSRFMGWLCTTHVRRWRAHRGEESPGHLYQGRFRTFMIQPDDHLLTMLRYVEANPLRRKKAKSAQDWDWSSLTGTAGADSVSVQLGPFPANRTDDWTRQVNRRFDKQTLELIRTSIRRSRPFGDEKWTKQMVLRHGLEWTVRDPWRPSKKLKPVKTK